MSDKQLVLKAVEDMPESASLDHIRDELDLMASIRRGEADIAAGRVHSHEEVREMVRQWTSR